MTDEQGDAPETPQERLQRMAATFDASVKEFRALVFCVNCGSTRVDQNSIYQLYCHNCGNSVYWNTYRFSIFRNDYTYDFLDAFRGRRLSDYDEWHKQVDDATMGWIEAIVTDSFHKDDPVEEREDKLEAAWEAYKAQVEELLQRRR